MTSCSAMLLQPRTAVRFPQLKVLGHQTWPTTQTPKLRKPASCLVLKSLPYFKQKTTVPQGTFRSAAGASSAFARGALAKNIAEGRTDKSSACSRLITFTSARRAILLQATPFGREPKLASCSLWQKMR